MTSHRLPRDLHRGWYEASDPGDGNSIKINKHAHIPITTGASGETNTLDDPTGAGQRLVLTMITDGGGDRVITADTAINQTGDTIMTFGAARDTIVLESILIGVDTYAWHVMANDGVALS